MNTWLYTHLRYFGDEYRREDGTPDEKRYVKVPMMMHIADMIHIWG